MQAKKAIRASLIALALLVVLFAFWMVSDTEPQDTEEVGLPKVQLTIAGKTINVELAKTTKQRATGLMWRKELAFDDGILFVFDEPGAMCFWMKNTHVPLTAAFIADDGTIVNLADMEPLSLDEHCAKKPIRHVLEMGKGWFEHHSIAPGLRFFGGPF